MIKVVVTGSECTGKSTLAAALAKSFDAVLVPEYARLFVEEQGRAPESGDVERIARGQIALEEELSATSPELLILDTDLLSTWIYAIHYYGRCPEWIDREIFERRADLYLLADIDVPWVADGDQRDRGHARPEMQRLFRDELVTRSLVFANIHGSRQRRLDAASRAVSALEPR